MVFSLIYYRIIVSFICRYLSTNPSSITTYGFMDINFNTESSCIKHEAGTFYFFVPQVDLHSSTCLFTLPCNVPSYLSDHPLIFIKCIFLFELAERGKAVPHYSKVQITCFLRLS